jgi:hypothetical protein
MKFMTFIISFSFCLAGCGLLRNSSKYTSETEDKSLDHANSKFLKEKEMRTELNITSHFKDSANHNYEIQIWPKGTFSLSEDKGFIGQAERIQVKGKSGRLTNGGITSRKLEQSKEGLLLADQQSKLKVTGKKELSKQTSPSWKVTLISALLILGVVWWIGKRLSAV